MTIFHVPFISATYSTLWSWACLQIYWYKYNIIQSLSYTQLQMFANSQNMWRFAMFQQRFGTKLIFQSWRIEWFRMILRWFTAKLARSSGHNGGHSKWISCLLWSRSFRSCGLWASDPRVARDSDGKNSVNHLVKFAWKLLDISIAYVCNFHERSFTMDLNEHYQQFKRLRWNSTMDLLACLTVKISADLDDEDENPWSLLHVLNVLLRHPQIPPWVRRALKPLSVILMFWSDHITF